MLTLSVDHTVFYIQNPIYLFLTDTFNQWPCVSSLTPINRPTHPKRACECSCLVISVCSSFDQDVEEAPKINARLLHCLTVIGHPSMTDEKEEVVVVALN